MIMQGLLLAGEPLPRGLPGDLEGAPMRAQVTLRLRKIVTSR